MSRRKEFTAMVRASKRRDIQAIRRAGRRDRAPMLAVLDALYGLARKRGEYNGSGVSPIVPFTHPILLSWTRKKWDLTDRSLRRLLPIMDELGLIHYQAGHGDKCSLVGLPTLYRDYALFSKKAVEKDAEAGPRWWKPLCARLLGQDRGLEPIDIPIPDEEDTYDLGFDLWDDEQVREAEEAAKVLMETKQALERPAPAAEQPTEAEGPTESLEEQAEAQREIAAMWRHLGDIHKAERAEKLAQELSDNAVENGASAQPLLFLPDPTVDSLSSHTPLGAFRSKQHNSTNTQRTPTLSEMSETPAGDPATSAINAIAERLQKGKEEDPTVVALIEANEERRALAARKQLPKHAEHITCSWFTDGKWRILQEEAHVLSDGAWATVVFKFRELDPRTDKYRPSKFAMRRYRRANGAYRYTSGFNLTSERQMRDTIDVLMSFGGDSPSPAEEERAA